MDGCKMTTCEPTLLDHAYFVHDAVDVASSVAESKGKSLLHNAVREALRSQVVESLTWPGHGMTGDQWKRERE